MFEIARQADLQLVFTDRQITLRRAPRLSGNLTVGEMLSKALDGSGYTYVIGRNRTVRIVPLAERAGRTPIADSQSATLPTPADSEIADSSPSSAAAPPEAPEIIVTGTSIKGSRVTDLLPVTVVDERYIDGTGAVSGSELFASIPQAGFVAFNESRTVGGVNDARGDTASVNLRGIGTGNTLILLNGRRMVLHPGTQAENLVPVTSVNTNAIPVLGIERLEILRDGASAIYGTDAVAGVVNTILKRDIEGVTLQAQIGLGEDTPLLETTLSGLAGMRFNGGATRLSLFGSYTNREGLRARDRPFSRSADHRPLVEGTEFEGDTDFDNRSTSTPFGVFQAVGFGTIRVNGVQLSSSSGAFHVQPATNPGCRVAYTSGLCFDDAGFSATDDRNLRYNINDERSLLSDLERFNAFAFLNHEFGSGIEAFAEAGYYRGVTDQRREQGAPLTAARITIPRTNFYNPFGPTILNGAPNPNRLPGLNIPASGLDLNITGYRLVDVGPRRIHVENDSFRLLGGILLAAGRPRQRRRFSISHELGHFLIPSHRPQVGHPFECSLADLHQLDAKDRDRHRRVEAEANRFAAHLLMPPARVRAAISQSPSGLESLVAMAREFGVSKEAMARAWVEAHREPVAVIVAHRARVLRCYRSEDFPWLPGDNGQPLPMDSIAIQTSPTPGCYSPTEEIDADVWLTERDAARTLLLTEQVLGQRDDYALVLLQAEMDEN